jgi:hypothetical protein
VTVRGVSTRGVSARGARVGVAGLLAVVVATGCQAAEDRGQPQAGEGPALEDLDEPAQEACRLYRSLGLVGTGNQNQEELTRRVEGIAAAAEDTREEGLRVATRRLANAVRAEDETAFARAAEQVTLTCVGDEMER